MKRQQVLGLLILLAVTTAVIGADALDTERQRNETAEESGYTELLTNTPAAKLDGEAISPDGRFEVRAAGKSDFYISGVVAPDKLRVVDRATGAVFWEDMGYLWQSTLWSPDSQYLALAYGARTWQAVKLFETDTWTSWDFALPDGLPIPEYTFLPSDQPWGIWQRKSNPEEGYDLLLTVGRGGDAGEQHTYRCSLLTNNGKLAANSLEQIVEVLPGVYDFNHDGEQEIAELVTLGGSENGQSLTAWYELRISKKDGRPLWSQMAANAHVGWTSIFTLKLDGQDYLLRYNPWMGQGYATYNYQIFSLDEADGEVLLKENGVDFDISFGSPHHGSFDPAAIAAFLEEVHGYLDNSTLLMTTEGGEFRTGGSGTEFREDMDFWDACCPYDESKSLEENLRNYKTFSKELRGIE